MFLKTLIIFSIAIMPIAANGQVLSKDYFFEKTLQLNYISSINNINNELNAHEEKESPLRRFEITFFISLPFVFLANFITLHVYEVIKQKDFNVSVWKEHKTLLPTATAAITTTIALRESYIAIRSSKNENSVGSLKKQSLYFSFIKSY